MKITKQELREIIQEVAEEMGLIEGLTKAQEKLPEPLKKAILKKQESDGTSDDDADEDSIEEGNAFGAAVKAARENGDSEFQVNGKTYPLKEKVIEESEDTDEFVGDDEDDVEEGNAFGAAVTKAKEDGEDEFEVDGKTYQVKEASCSEEDEEDVEEGNAFGAAVTKAKEDGDKEFEVDGKTYKVTEDWKKITLAEKLDRILGNKKVL
tara:strand:- start:16 stop:639 length:624 start_codon:yes stop_codon:yes gene_type:complete